MTRTERASHPRALVKDRSESKSGLDKHVAKNGAGAHAWGSIADEYDHEFADADLDDSTVAAEPAKAKPVPVRRVSGEPTAQEREYARQLRARKDLDLGSIARTSAGVSQSPPQSAYPTTDSDGDGDTDASSVSPSTAKLPHV